MSRLPPNKSDEYDGGAGAEPNVINAGDQTGHPLQPLGAGRELAKSSMGGGMDGSNAEQVAVIDVKEGNLEEALAQQTQVPKKKNLLQRFLEFLFPPGSMLSSVFTLASSTVGVGILGLPSVFNTTGYILSIILLVVISLQTIFSLWLLARTASASRKRTYEDVILAIMGRGPDWLLAIVMCLFCAGGGIAYVISIGNLLTPVFDDPSVPEFWRSKIGNSIVTSAIWLVFILPLCLPKRIDSLRHTSMIGCICMFFFVICIMIDASRYMHQNGFRSDLEPFGSGNSAIQGLGTIMFACLVQINAFEVYSEMSKPSPRRMARDSAVAMSCCGVVYILAGFFGYMRFGKGVTDSILLMYKPRTDVLFAIAYVGIVFKICVAFALHQLPLRDGIYHMLGWDAFRMSWCKNAICCAFFSLVLLVFGLLIPNINMVFGVVGPLCGGFIGFIYPALLVMYCGNWTLTKVGLIEYLATYLLLIAGCVAIVFGTAVAIYGMVPK